MSQLIPLNEAARMLGVSTDRLTEMRSNNEIFGYRDGATWKFKLQEIQRVAEDLGISLGSGKADSDDDDFELSDSSGNDSLQLLADSGDDLLLEDSGDDSEELPAGTGKRASDIDEDDLLFGGSSLKLAAEGKGAGKDKPKKPADIHEDDLIPKKNPESSTGKLLAALEAEEDRLELAPAEDELELADDDSSQEDSELESDFEDSEIVLDDSDSSSELVLSSDDPPLKGGKRKAGSDLALESSLDSGGSDIDSLDLAADEDVLSLGDMADPDAATMMQEDDFQLGAVEEADPDESSGSQVIALEDSDLFTDSSGDPLADSGEGLSSPEVIVEEDGLEAGYADALGGSALAGVGGQAMVMGRPEVPYSMLQVLALGLVALTLALGCTLLWDIARNLWMAEDRVISSGLLKIILDTLGIQA
jgi:hypothetical protein